MGGRSLAPETHLDNEHTLCDMEKEKKKRTNISKTSPLNVNTVETIATRLAASSAA